MTLTVDILFSQSIHLFFNLQILCSQIDKRQQECFTKIIQLFFFYEVCQVFYIIKLKIGVSL